MTEVDSHPCPRCGEVATLVVRPEDLEAWNAGHELPAGAFAYLSASDRERLTSGWCPECWDMAWPDLALYEQGLRDGYERATEAATD